MRYITYILLLIVIIMGITFAILNSTSVPLNYYVGQRVMPLSLLLVSFFAIGCVMGMLVSLWMMMGIKIKNHQLRKQLKITEKEIENLRTIPIRDKH